MSESSSQEHADKKTQVRDYFSRTASNYVASVSHSTGSDLPHLIEIGEWEPQQEALDIATGGGHTARTIAPHVANVTVTDLTPKMLEKAKAFLLEQGVTNARFEVADAESLPFSDASFDRVTCRIAPHHFPDIAQAVREVARVLKPGGLFLLVDNSAPSEPELDIFSNKVEKWRDPSHGRACTQEEWLEFFAQAGLEVELAERFRRVHNYDDWTARAQMAAKEKAALEAYMLDSGPQFREYFAFNIAEDGHLIDFATDYQLLKGRKKK